MRVCTAMIVIHTYLDIFYTPAGSWNVKKPLVPLSGGGFGETERGLGATSGLHIFHQIVVESAFAHASFSRQNHFVHRGKCSGCHLFILTRHTAKGVSRLIWTPLKLVPPGTNFSEIFGPTLKNLFLVDQPHQGKSVHVNSHEVITKDISGVHRGIF